MATYSLTIHRDQLEINVTRALGKSALVRNLALKKFAGIFDSAHRAMLREFDRHPITNELIDGIEAANISHTLDGYGNLYSFIGFKEGSQPTEDIRALLAVATTYRQTVYQNRQWFFKLYTPSREAIQKVTPMPWEAGNSWVAGIEQGMSNLSHFMFKRWGGGRSGGGFQLPYENQELNFSKRPYITEILKNFRDRMGNIRHA